MVKMGWKIMIMEDERGAWKIKCRSPRKEMIPVQ